MKCGRLILALFFIVFSALEMHAARKSFEQSRVTVKVKNVTLSDVLWEIYQQTDFTFIYSTDDIKTVTIASLDIKNASLEEALTQCLNPNGLTYNVSGDVITVSRVPQKKVATSKETATKMEQSPETIVSEISVTGTIISSADNLPIIGAMVYQKGNTSNGVITDLDGNFAIKVPSDAILVFSSMGYQTAEMKPASVMRVILDDEAELLNAVVFVGYGVQKKVNLTGSVSVVESEDLVGRSSSNTSNLLVGIVPNMNVTSDNGRPGSGSSINIRGVNSISSSAGPYVLVDGVEGSIDRVNPNDIESISVLKDASSAAIYGAKAAFGVILITTKQGKDGKAHVDYNGRFTFHSPAVSTDFETRGYYSAAMVDYFSRQLKGQNFTTYDDEDYYQLWIRRNDKTEHPDRPWVVEKNGQYAYYANMDWFNYFFENERPTQEHNVSIYGGTDKINYRISAGYYNQDGVLKQGKGDTYTRYDMRAKISAQVTDWLKVSNNTSFYQDQYPYYTRGNVRNLFRSTAIHGLASIPATNPDGTAIWKVSSYAAPNDYKLMSGYAAVAENGGTYNQDDNNNFSTTFEVVLTPLKGLRVTGDYTFTMLEYRAVNRQIEVPYSQYPGVVEYVDLVDKLTETRKDGRMHTANVYANYSKTFAEAHNMSLMLGAFYNTRFNYDWAADRTGLISDDLSDFNLATGEEMSISGGKSRYINNGLFFRAGYDYKGRYLAEFNARYDGSSRFPKGNRYGFFPSVSAGWRMSEEEWFAPAKKVVSNLKIRASYGKLGNNEVSNYGYIQTINSNAEINYLFGGQNLASGTSASAPNASDYSWEVVTSANIGLDISFFDNRLSFSGDAYIRDTDGMFMASTDLPAVYGASAPKSNAASLRTKGWEFMIDWKDSFELAGQPFHYSVGFSLADNISDVVHYNNDNKTIGTPYTGERLGDIWGYVIDGYFQSEEQIRNHRVDQSYVNSIINTSLIDNGLHPGDLKFVDMDGDRKILPTTSANDVKDMVIIGNSLPRFTHTFRFSANWMGIDLSLLFNGVGRQHWYPGGETYLFWGPYSRPFVTYIPMDIYDKIWSEDNPDAYFPRPRGWTAFPGGGGPRQLTVVNNRYLQNVAYFRLKNLTLGYSLPKKWTDKIKIEKVRLYFSGENLFTLSPIKSKYIDPAMAGSSCTWQTGNTDVYGYPTARAYSFGLDITF